MTLQPTPMRTCTTPTPFFSVPKSTSPPPADPDADVHHSHAEQLLDDLALADTPPEEFFDLPHLKTFFAPLYEADVLEELYAFSSALGFIFKHFVDSVGEGGVEEDEEGMLPMELVGAVLREVGLVALLEEIAPQGGQVLDQVRGV